MPASCADIERQILTLSEVMTLIGYRSRSTVHGLVRAGIFPPPIRLAKRRIGWRRSEIDRWLTERVGVSATAPRSKAA